MQVPNYYKIIKQPMDLKKAKKKLQLRSSQYYQSTQEFVSDMRLIFKNCAQYNEVSSMTLALASGNGTIVCVHATGPILHPTKSECKMLFYQIHFTDLCWRQNVNLILGCGTVLWHLQYIQYTYGASPALSVSGT